jgi:acyl carrier protein
LSRNALQDERRTFLEAVGQLWLDGAEINWATLHEGSQPRRVPLPSYAFDRKRYWIEQRRRLFNSHPSAIEMTHAEQPEVAVAAPAAAINGNHENGQEAESFGPHHAIEVRLVEIWKSYLGVENVGVRQSFFEMGGDSLLASRLHSQLRREFDIELPLAMMFELETIRHLALYIAISRNPELVDTLSERDLDDVLAVLEAWPVEGRPGMAKRTTTS